MHLGCFFGCIWASTLHVEMVRNSVCGDENHTVLIVFCLCYLGCFSHRIRIWKWFKPLHKRGEQNICCFHIFKFGTPLPILHLFLCCIPRLQAGGGLAPTQTPLISPAFFEPNRSLGWGTTCLELRVLPGIAYSPILRVSNGNGGGEGLER